MEKEKEKEKPSHILPLLTPPTTTTAAAAAATITNSSGILLRLSFLVLISLISIWANHESSKGYAITLINQSPNTFSGTRFQLFYLSNDQATRILLHTSKTFQNFLYPPTSHPHKKPVRHVILALHHAAYPNSTHDDDVTVALLPDNEFLINLSPRLLQKPNFKDAVFSALQKGMARVWLWDGPPNLVNGIVEYLTMTPRDGRGILQPVIGPARARGATTTAGTCWDDGDARAVADFLTYGEGRSPGFVRRLNQLSARGGDGEDSDGIIILMENMCREYRKLGYNSSSV